MEKWTCSRPLRGRVCGSLWFVRRVKLTCGIGPVNLGCSLSDWIASVRLTCGAKSDCFVAGVRLACCDSRFALCLSDWLSLEVRLTCDRGNVRSGQIGLWPSTRQLDSSRVRDGLLCLFLQEKTILDGTQTCTQARTCANKETPVPTQQQE